MKYLKISLIKTPGGLTYPLNYQTEIGDFAQDHLYYDENSLSYLLLCIDDIDFKPTMIRENVVEVTEAEATAISDAHETRVETILDEAKLRRIELLSRLGMALSTADQDAIDPAKPGSIFSTTKTLTDRIPTLKLNETARAAIARAKGNPPIA